MAETWATFNKLAKQVKAYPVIEKQELNELFLQIEKLIFEGINHLLQATTFVEDNLCYLLAEIASGIIKNRKVYKGKIVRKRVNIGEGDAAVEMGADNLRILGNGLDLFKLSRTEREFAVPYVKRIIRNLQVANNFYENMLIAFSKEAADYIKLSDRMAFLTLELQDGREFGFSESRAESTVMQEMAELMEDIRLIEVNVGCVVPNILYGVVRDVSKLLRKIRRIQERILKAYSRLILIPVRAKAQGEMEAFDLFQAGSLGLSRAISLYNVYGGTAFPTFANQWIKQRIFKLAKVESPLVRLPNSVFEMAQAIKRAERHFESDPEMQHKYTVNDIADHLGTSVKSIKQVLGKLQSTQIVPIESLVHQTEEGYSDDTQADKVLLDDSFEENEYAHETREFINRILEHVDVDQRNLICLRYGVIDSISNNRLSKKQMLKEILRQTLYKSIIQAVINESAENLSGLAHSEALPEEAV